MKKSNCIHDFMMRFMKNINPRHYYVSDWHMGNASHFDNVKLVIASSNGWDKIVESLVSIGISLDPEPGSPYLNVLLNASVNGQYHVVRYLTSLPNVNFQGTYKSCILWAKSTEKNHYYDVINYLTNLIHEN